MTVEVSIASGSITLGKVEKAELDSRKRGSGGRRWSVGWRVDVCRFRCDPIDQLKPPSPSRMRALRLTEYVGTLASHSAPAASM